MKVLIKPLDTGENLNEPVEAVTSLYDTRGVADERGF